MNEQQYLPIIIADCNSIKALTAVVKQNISNMNEDNYLLLFKKAMSRALELSIMDDSF